MPITTKRLMKFLFIQLIARKSLGESFIGSTKPEYSYGLIEATGKIVKSCHRSETNTVGIAGDFPDGLIASLMSEERFSVVFIDERAKLNDRPTMPPISRSKLQLFIIAVHSTTEPRELLINIKNTPWWNHMGNFYMIDWSVNGDNCAMAFDWLWAAWSTNILHATFICVDGDERIIIKSFNPYTSAAPESWRLEKTYDGRNNHPWSLLVGEYSKDDDTCENTNFDRTKDLGGYEIVATVMKSWNIRILNNESGIRALDNAEGDFFVSMFNALNASVKLLIHESEENAGSISEEGVANGVLAETYYGKSDIYLRERNLLRLAGSIWTYPHYYTGQSVVTQYSGRESQLKKIVSLFDGTSRIGLGLVCLLTPIFLKLFQTSQTSTIAILNTVRLICNSCLPGVPFETSSRIYLSAMFLSVVTIQGTYQGGLSSLLAKRVLLSNVDTIEDLAKSHHKIYARQHNRGFFASEEFQGRFVGIEDNNCTGRVSSDPSAACVKSRNHLLADAATSKLHLSEYYMVRFPLGWVIREDWPLEGKINTIIQSLVEADVFRLSYEKPHEKLLRKIRANDNEDRDRSFKILNIEDLEFAFAILGTGLGLAGVTFIVEVLGGKDVFAKIPTFLRYYSLRPKQ